MERADQITCDIVVVGLGAMGSAIVDQLAIRGIDVVGVSAPKNRAPLEPVQEDVAGTGSSPPPEQEHTYQNTDITYLNIGENESYLPFTIASHKRWRELEEESGTKLFEQCGAVVTGMDDESLRSSSNIASRFGIRYQTVDLQRLISQYPQFAHMRNDGTAYYEAESGYLYSENCIRVQLEHAQSCGAKLYLEESAGSMGQQFGRFGRFVGDQEFKVNVQTENLRIRARQGIATGSWISRLLGNHYEKYFHVIRQQEFWFALDEEQNFPSGSPEFIGEHCQGDAFYVLPPLHGEDVVKVGGDPNASTKWQLAGVSDRVLKSDLLLKKVPVDNNFILDYHPNMPNVFLVSSCGQRFKDSAGVGKAVVEKICGEQSEFDLSPFQLTRFHNVTFSS